MASSTDTQEGRDQTSVEVANSVTPEVRVAAAQAVLAEGNIGISETLRGRREETLVLVRRLLASAGIEGTFSTPKDDEPKQVTVELSKTGAPDDKELSREKGWLVEFKARFDALPQLHRGVSWEDVEKSLKADPEAMRKLQILDEAGFEMNVFSEENGEIVFRTAQTDVTKIAAKYRTIMYDKKAQADFPHHRVNGNAEEIAASMGVELADVKLYNQCRVKNGWIWLKTDAATRRDIGGAFRGRDDGIRREYARYHDVYGSFCAALRVKKA